MLKSMWILLIVLVLLLGGGSYYYGRDAGWRAPQYGGGLVGLVLVVSLILWLTNSTGADPMMIR
jgi:hypothetical protein